MKCTLDESLSQVVERIVKAEVHRIVVVDNQDHVIGMISLSDILSFLVLRPVGMERKESSTLQQHALLEESEDGVTDDDDFIPDEDQPDDRDVSSGAGDKTVAADISPESSSVFSKSPQIPQVTVTASQEKSASSSPQRKQCIERQDEEDEEEAEPEAKPVECGENSSSRRILTTPVDIVG